VPTCQPGSRGAERTTAPEAFRASLRSGHGGEDAHRRQVAHPHATDGRGAVPGRGDARVSFYRFESTAVAAPPAPQHRREFLAQLVDLARRRRGEPGMWKLTSSARSLAVSIGVRPRRDNRAGAASSAMTSDMPPRTPLGRRQIRRQRIT
jgi:hypothetical protein